MLTNSLVPPTNDYFKFEPTHLHMPYIVSFVKSLEIPRREHYINECCVGGDIVLEQLVPALSERYGDLELVQEDWGWFACFAQASVKLAVDVYTDDGVTGEFQVHLTSRKPRLVVGTKIADTPELESLRELILAQLQAWAVTGLQVEHVNEKYMPTQP